MTFEKFHNALRIMRSIDLQEIHEAGFDMTPSEWDAFRSHPHDWFILARDRDAKVIWSIIEERNK
jgi:hypothetical protein